MKKRFVLYFIPIIVFIVCVMAVCVYKNTFININNEKSIQSHFSVNQNSPVKVLAMEKFNDYAGILYTDPDSENNGEYCFRYLKKFPLGKNLYHNYGGYSKTNADGVNCIEIYEDGSESCILFIFALKSNDNTCSVFNINTVPVTKLDEIKIDNVPFVIAKKYHVTEDNNSIAVFDGALSVDDVSQLLSLFEAQE